MLGNASVSVHILAIEMYSLLSTEFFTFITKVAPHLSPLQPVIHADILMCLIP